MLCKSPEEVVVERHKSKQSQPTLEQCTKKNKEAKVIVDDHVADFFYENRIPLNVINSRSWEVLLESIGQYGPGYRSPSYHDVRTPLLERAVNRTVELRKKHEEAWKEYGCTIMSDGWTDTSHRHLINFLANSPAGTFFLGSVDASSEIANANILADLLEKQIDKVGKEHVVQIVTDNGANFKAAGRLLMERIPHLFWTPCPAHCLDLLLEDIGKIKEFHTCINMAQKVTRFMYKHGRVLDLMRNKIGEDLVRPAVTRFATSFLTLASLHKNRSGLRNLVVSDEWHATTLRIADGDETPTTLEIMAAMDVAKAAIKDSLQRKLDLLKEVLKYYDNRWENQMEQQLYGVALYLNPSKFFALKEKDRRQAGRLRIMFNQVMWKMVTDDEEQNKISKQAEDYERAKGESFSQPGAIRVRDRKNHMLWWGAYGGLTYELQCLAKRIVSLCCAASGCERSWSDFSAVHTKKRNRLEHQRLNKLVYVSYNRKMENKFKKIRELGSKGKICNPLLLDEFHWENEWVNENCEPEPVQEGGGDAMTWAVVDEAIGASQGLEGRNLPRAAATRAAVAAPMRRTYARNRKCPRNTVTPTQDIDEVDDEDQDQHVDSAIEMEEDEESAPIETGDGPTGDGDGGFTFNVDLLN
ncbi:uncharacterized protein [Miscanthus floridulus]|uniref:uncharacterized protein n=1 Tax=Miscanthus floridulus TaxID=154761 RepID=UPI0034594609